MEQNQGLNDPDNTEENTSAPVGQADLQPKDVGFNPEEWENPPSLEDLKADLTESKPAHEAQKNKIRKWLDNLNIEGSAKLPKQKGSSNIQPKLIRKQAEWRYAALSEPFLAVEDMFDIDPVTFEDVEPARQNELVLNNQFNTKMDKVSFIDDYVRTAVDEGTVIVKLGWEFQEEEYTRQRPVVKYIQDVNSAPLHAELAEMKESNPTGYKAEVPEELRMAHDYAVENNVAVLPNVTGYEEITDLRTTVNIPDIEVQDYRNVIIDPSCGKNIDKASFVIFKFESSKSELLKDGKYDADRVRSIRADAASPLASEDYDTETDNDFKFSDDARKRVVVYEYWGDWDIDGSGMTKPVVISWVGDTIIRMGDNKHPDKKLPLVVVPMLPVRRSVYGEPDGALLEDNQAIIGAITRGMIDIMGRSANGQTGTRKDALDAVNKRKMARGEDYEYNGGVDPRVAFYMHTYPEIPNSAPLMLQMQNAEAESMTGVKAFSGGINSEALGDVATGIRGALDSAGQRETAILRRLAAGMALIGRKVISMNSEWLEDEEIIRITNENFVAVRRDDLGGNFDLRVTISTTDEDNVKAKELAFMLQTMGSVLDQGMLMLILRDIARLRKMPELAKQIENYQPKPDPIVQATKEAELEKLLAETSLLRAKEEAELAGAGLDDAKAREASSNADQKDLDFVEQESGVTQERDKEKLGVQAAGNKELETHKANLEEKKNKNEELTKFLNKGK